MCRSHAASSPPRTGDGRKARSVGTVSLIPGVNMKFKIVSTLVAFSVALLALSGCAETPGSDTSNFRDCGGVRQSASVIEGAVGESSAREALRVWVEEAGAISTDLPASDWVETDSSDDVVRFQGEKDWAAATQLPGGWLVLDSGTCDQ